ncbi:PREDICTED: CMRF35-like molecule 4 [Condylura cristata]|uniref:CMRF35-like molecule 4 n=1 Tax=Condylura cristata TaxID=143302 RepID=UPI0003343F01|nr:PREDICTED: CMRF35-like molecule 4 [Condylura cristata]
MDRSQAGGSVWPLPALLLLLLAVPGGLPIQGPWGVSGPVGGLVTIRCHYGSGWETYVKWWCRGQHWRSCDILVRTTGSEEKVRRGRVTIQDDQGQRAVNVTIEELRPEDEDIYWCGVERRGTDLGHQVRVSVYSVTTEATTEATTLTDTPAPTRADTPEANTMDAPPSVDPEPPATLSANGSSLTVHDLLTRALGCNMHFLVLTLVKVPLLGGLLCTVMWLSRSRGDPKRE